MNLTREQILGLPAGRETDAIVAEARGWKKSPQYPQFWWMGGDADELKNWTELPFFSIDIAAAWALLPESGWSIHLTLSNKIAVKLHREDGSTLDTVYAPTAALAIVRAFLLSKLEGK